MYYRVFNTKPKCYDFWSRLTFLEVMMKEFVIAIRPFLFLVYHSSLWWYEGCHCVNESSFVSNSLPRQNYYEGSITSDEGEDKLVYTKTKHDSTI